APARSTPRPLSPSLPYTTLFRSLRQLVDGVATQEPAERCHARVVRDLEHPRITARAQVLVEMRDVELPRLRVDAHRAELQDLEGLLALSHPDLPEEHGTGGSELDRQGDEREQGCDDDDRGTGD